MELNGRAWGSMALARRRGFEYPAWNVHAALDPDFVPVEPADPPEILARHLGMELAHSHSSPAARSRRRSTPGPSCGRRFAR